MVGGIRGISSPAHLLRYAHAIVVSPSWNFHPSQCRPFARCSRAPELILFCLCLGEVLTRLKQTNLFPGRIRYRHERLHLKCLNRCFTEHVPFLNSVVLQLFFSYRVTCAVGV